MESLAGLLFFGLEMEMLVRPRSSLQPLLNKAGWNKKVASGDPTPGRGPEDPKRLAAELPQKLQRKILRHTLAASLTKDGVKAVTSPEDYLALTIADEPSLDEVKPDFWRLELVTRIMNTNEDWQREVDRIFSVLNEYCEIRLTVGCSMHIHVSPTQTGDLQQKYTIVQLRSILNAISFYDAAITQIMPAERKNTLWAQSNVNGEKTPSKIKMAYRAVPQRSWGPLFSIFGSIKMKAMVHREMGQDKYMSWNFGHLMDQCGTIEFRRPPGVRTAADAKHWAAFTLGFINMAMTMSNGWAQHGTATSHPSVKDLQRFVRAGVARLGPSCNGALNDDRIEADNSPACVYSATEIEIINRKKSEKNKFGSVFAEKANSRPNTPSSRPSSHSSSR
ncbi:putative Amidoligase enzyme [Seiridium cardinale]